MKKLNKKQLGLIRLHRGRTDATTFYWNIETKEKVADELIPKNTYTPEQQFVAQKPNIPGWPIKIN